MAICDRAGVSVLLGRPGGARRAAGKTNRWFASRKTNRKFFKNRKILNLIRLHSTPRINVGLRRPTFHFFQFFFFAISADSAVTRQWFSVRILKHRFEKSRELTPVQSSAALAWQGLLPSPCRSRPVLGMCALLCTAVVTHAHESASLCKEEVALMASSGWGVAGREWRHQAVHWASY